MTQPVDKQGHPPFQIFRAHDARDYSEAGPMHMAEMGQAEQQGLAAMAEAGLIEGSKVKLL